jgi:hypothetical protein
MKTELILDINKELVEKATLFAKTNNISLSILVERHLISLISENETPSSIKRVSIVDELSGILKLDDDYDYKDEWMKKHL